MRDQTRRWRAGQTKQSPSAFEHSLGEELTDGEPTEFAEPGVRARQAAEAARILGVERCSLGLRDRLLMNTPEVRLALARLIREHQPRWVYGTGEACVHPDHAAAVGITRDAVFLARHGQWERVRGALRSGTAGRGATVLSALQDGSALG